jgi:hypothetical protein
MFQRQSHDPPDFEKHGPQGSRACEALIPSFEHHFIININASLPWTALPACLFHLQLRLVARPSRFISTSSIRVNLISRHRRGIGIASTFIMSSAAGDPERDHALQEFKKKLLDSREMEARLKALRVEIKGLQKDYDLSEDNIKALQSVGQIIGEVLKQLDEERCMSTCIHYKVLTCQSLSKPPPDLATLLDADPKSTRKS